MFRGLQSSQSGSGDHPSSPARKKQRMLPPSIPGQGDLWDHLCGRQWQTSQGGSSASSQAESKVTKTKYQGGMGRTGGNQSSSHHKRTNQGQESSSSLGSLRPPPHSTATTLSTTSKQSRVNHKGDPDQPAVSAGRVIAFQTFVHAMARARS